MTDPAGDEVTSGHFAYFTVRLRVPGPGEAASLAGVVERLGTGRKRSFSDGQQLLCLLAEWSHAPSIRVTEDVAHDHDNED